MRERRHFGPSHPAGTADSCLGGEGLANKAIAAHLGVSVRTVEGHMNHVFAKLGLETRTELVRFALTNGLARPDASEGDLSERELSKLDE